jgi:hypothetical protein
MTTPTPPAQDGERERLPAWYEVSVKRDEGIELTPLELFIYENEPAGRGQEKEFRQQLSDALSAELAALRAQVEGLSKDAARYQWIRETLFSDFIGEPDECRDANRAWNILESGGFEGDDAELDSCIDAALAPPQSVAKETKP